ncbi:hypothetical protein RIF29_38991 [Crotalaria pallida]|uniref:Cytochrome c oxidase assembly factor 5 n=1 Tax=Crotalaria pallida TaxID=3830 RepID=A0AAN9HSW5_CROPI
MSKSCKGLAAELVKCLSESDCVKVENRSIRECAGEKSPSIPSECVGLRETYFNCKRGQASVLFFTYFVVSDKCISLPCFVIDLLAIGIVIFLADVLVLAFTLGLKHFAIVNLKDSLSMYQSEVGLQIPLALKTGHLDREVDMRARIRGNKGY